MSSSPFLDAALPLREPSAARWVWATVTQSTPLRIQIDGDLAPLGITPDDLSDRPQPVGQRVYCQILNRRLTIFGPMYFVVPSLTVYTVAASWTKPSGLTAARVRVWGPGGSGGGRVIQASGSWSVGGGGGGGGYAEAVIPASALPASVSIAVGPAVAGVVGGNGVASTVSSFGTFLIANPGQGGATVSGLASANVAAGGGGGGASSASGVSGALLLTGQTGMYGYAHGGSTYLVTPGAGGSSGLGGSGGFAPAPGQSGQAYAGGTPGGGGSGLWGTTGASAAGASSGAGRVAVEHFFA